MTTMCDEVFEKWVAQVKAVVLEHAGQRLQDFEEPLPLAECHQLGMTPFEVFLWHVREPELPAGDVYADSVWA